MGWQDLLRMLKAALPEPSKAVPPVPEIVRLTLGDAAKILDAGDSWTAVALAAHPNGYIRELAVKRLAANPEVGFPFLLTRANDWAAPVAHLAQRILIHSLPTVSSGALERSIDSFMALLRSRRHDTSRLIDLVLQEVASRPGLASAFRRRASRNSTLLYECLRGDDETPEDVVREALASPNTLVQTWGARQVKENFLNLRTLLHGARSPAVRRLALDFAPPEVLERALRDSNAGVRNDARFLLGKRDYASHYRTRLPEAGAISGLGETGGPEDAALLRPLLTHERAEVRRRAVEGLQRLIGEEAISDLMVALRDPSRKVQRAAIDALSRLTFAVDPQEVVGLDLARSQAWLLMTHAPRWAALLAVLEAPDGFPDAENWLRSWALASNRSQFIPPREGEAAEALRRIEGLQSDLAAELRVPIQSWIR